MPSLELDNTKFEITDVESQTLDNNVAFNEACIFLGFKKEYDLLINQEKLLVLAIFYSGIILHQSIETDFEKFLSIIEQLANAKNPKAISLKNLFDSKKEFSEEGNSPLIPFLDDSDTRQFITREQIISELQFRFACRLQNGIKVDKNPLRAFYYFEKALENRHPNAPYQLAQYHLNGLTDPNNNEPLLEKNHNEAIELYKKGDISGDHLSTHELALCYHQGVIDSKTGRKLIEKDPDKAFVLYKKARDNGNRNSGAILAICYETGFGCKINLGLAIDHYIEYSDEFDYQFESGEDSSLENFKHFKFYIKNNNKSLAFFYLAKCFQDGIVDPHTKEILLEVNEKKAFDNYKISSDLGYSAAHYELGRIYEKGILDHKTNKLILEKDLKQAFKYYEKAVREKYEDAYFKLSYFYEQGYGDCNKNTIVAEYWCSKKATLLEYSTHLGNIATILKDKKDSDALFFQEKANQESKKQRHDTSEVVKLNFSLQHYERLATKGNRDAQYDLGRIHRDGQGVEQSYKTAFKYFKMAADQGHMLAQFELGRMYDKAEGIELDYRKAFDYYKMAADQGHLASIFNLAVSYRKGEGVEQDNKMAFKYYKEAATKGDLDAQYYLGKIYRDGIGADKDDWEYFKLHALCKLNNYIVETRDWKYSPVETDIILRSPNLGISNSDLSGLNEIEEKIKEFVSSFDDEYISILSKNPTIHKVEKAQAAYREVKGVIKQQLKLLEERRKSIENPSQSVSNANVISITDNNNYPFIV